jgi:hypothetical protein
MRLVSRKWKYGNAIAVCVMAIALGQIGSAQESRDNQQATPPAAQPAQKPAEEPVTRVIAPAAMMQIPALKNIQVDITIIDQVGSEPPLKKTLSVIAVDAGSGSVRSKGFIAVPKQEPASRPGDYYYEELPLNVDIRPQVTENKNRIRMRLILNYETFRPKTTAGAVGRYRRSECDARQWQANDRVAVGGCDDRSQGVGRIEGHHPAVSASRTSARRLQHFVDQL